jgi:hypothetical protein
MQKGRKKERASQQFNRLLYFDNNILLTKVVDKTRKHLQIQEKTVTLAAIDNKLSETVLLSPFETAILHIHLSNSVARSTVRTELGMSYHLQSSILYLCLSLKPKYCLDLEIQ